MHFLSVSSNVLLVIAGIGMLIFIHELGHFLVAKKIGVRVYTFSLGFGPSIFKKKIGETEYCLSILPLGGYVKLAGEMQSKENTGEEWEFMSKTLGQRAAVLCAGVVLNALLAFIAFIVAFNVGVPFIGSEIGDVTPGWPAWEAGMQEGDKIVRINNNSDPDFEDIFTEIALSDTSSGVHLSVERDNRIFDITVFPKYDDQIGIQRIGIRPAASLEIDKIAVFQDSTSPAIEAGLQIGDRIVSVDDKTMKNGSEFIYYISANPGKELKMKLIRDGEEIELKITPMAITRWMIGLSSASTRIESVKKESIAHSIGLINGDEIISIDNQKVTGWSQLEEIITNANIGIHTLEVARNRKTELVELNITDKNGANNFLTGIYPYMGLVVDKTIKGFPAEDSGIMPGDKLVAIDDNKLTSWSQFLQSVVAAQGNPITITWIHNEKYVTETIIPIKDVEHPFGKIGVKLKDNTVLKKYGLLGSCRMGVEKTFVNIQRIYFTLKGFITGKVSNKALGGPILIAQASYESAKLGIGKLLYFLGIISINLAFLNILPVPVLDGGHLLFLLVEKIKGSPVSERTLSIANYVGMGMIISLVLFATRNDVMRIFNIL
ncbi:MAG: RIP metalloprotease RseP [Candidatus Anammoxibacter sp.]